MRRSRHTEERAQPGREQRNFLPLQEKEPASGEMKIILLLPSQRMILSGMFLELTACFHWLSLSNLSIQFDCSI